MENSWIIPAIILIVICFFLWKYGNFGKEENTYITPIKKCPYDQNLCPDFELTIDKTMEICRKCSRYKNRKPDKEKRIKDDTLPHHYGFKERKTK